MIPHMRGFELPNDAIHVTDEKNVNEKLFHIVIWSLFFDHSHVCLRGFILILFACMSQMLYGQFNDSTYIKGHIITYEDTFDCYIHYKTIDQKTVVIKKQYNTDNKYTIAQQDITNMRFRDFHFQRTNYQGKSYLFEKEAEGFVTLYSDYMETTMPSGGTFANTFAGSYLPYKEFYIKKDKVLNKIKRHNYMELLSDIFCRDSAVIAKLNNVTYGLLQGKLKGLVMAYNKNPANHPDSNYVKCYETDKDRKAKAGIYMPLALNYSLAYNSGEAEDINTASGGFGADLGLTFYYQTPQNIRFIFNTAYYTNKLNITYQTDDGHFNETITMQHLTIMPGTEFYGDNYFWGIGIPIGIINKVTSETDHTISGEDMGFVNNNYSPVGIKLYYGIPFKVLHPWISINMPFRLPVTTGFKPSFGGEKYDVGAGMVVFQLGVKVTPD